MQAFTLDQASGIPVKLQLKAHIKYQILAGLLRPGDQLPPLRDLAAGLGIHLNTVVRAVDDLVEEGYLYTHQGRGVFVADEFPGQGYGAALRSLLAGVLGASTGWGLGPEELALSLLAQAQLARQPQPASHRLLLVGGSRPHLKRLQAELEAQLPAIVVPVLADELPEVSRSSDFAVAAATLFHTADVRRLLPRATTIPLAPPSLVDAFGRLSSGTAVAVASRDWLHAARVRRSLDLFGPPGLELQVTAGQTPAALAPTLRLCQSVLATADCRELAREALGGNPDVTLLTEPVDIPAEAFSALKEALGIAPEESRVHVRSAWV